MNIETTVAELIFWYVLAGINLLILVVALLPWNNKYDPKGNDPYRYCPKDED